MTLADCATVPPVEAGSTIPSLEELPAGEQSIFKLGE
jgi:hypothetical protein